MTALTVLRNALGSFEAARPRDGRRARAGNRGRARRPPVHAGAVCGLLALGSTSCLLFTDPINEPPQVTITGPQKAHQGQAITFTAAVTDDGGPSRIEWARSPTCPADEAAARAMADAVPLGRDNPVRVEQREPESYCLFVLVRDAQGASAFDSHPVAIQVRTLVIEPPASLKSGIGADFRARFADEPGAIARAKLHWANEPTCEAARSLTAAAAASAPAMPGIDVFRVPLVPRSAFCVVAEGHDEFDIPLRAELMVTNIERGPLPVEIAASAAQGSLGPNGPGVSVPNGQAAWPIFSAIRLAGLEPGALGPDDVVTFTWKLQAPDGRALTPEPCADAALPGAEICLVVTEVGTYRIELTVLEAGLPLVAPPLALEVKDFAPCIRNTDPLYASAPKFFQAYDRDQVFHVVEVHDDGDPWPAPARDSQRGFKWSIREGGAPNPFRVRVDARFESFTIPARAYRPGDRIDVRVEYFDRQDLTTPRSGGAACLAEAGACEIEPGSRCFQSVSWTVEYL